MKEGFHLIEKKEIEKKEMETFEKISIINLLRLLKKKELKQFHDYTVRGFVKLFAEIDDEITIQKFLREELAAKSSYLNSTLDVFQIIIDNKEGTIEIWGDKPIINIKGKGKISLYEIFGNMSIHDDNPNWFWQQLNLES